jgi:flagellar biogenesis protein FliO
MNIQLPGTFQPRRIAEAISPRMHSNAEASPSGLLSRALLWLQTRTQTARRPRRLQLCATLALGEKRFVSIIECDGRQFLIGGGGAGSVSLLAQLTDCTGADLPEVTR